MFGPFRINIVSLIGSCAGHAALLGGFILAIQSVPSHTADVAPAEPAFVIDMIPLEKLVGADRGLDRSSQPVARRLMAEDRPLVTPSRIDRSYPPTGPANATAVVNASAVSAMLPGGAAFARSTAYQRALYEIVARNSRYPAAARRLDLAGVATLAFRLDRLGNVTASWIQASSGSQLLDDAALAALDRAKPLPPIPADLPDTLEFMIEIDSSVMRQSSDRADS